MFPAVQASLLRPHQLAGLIPGTPARCRSGKVPPPHPHKNRHRKEPMVSPTTTVSRATQLLLSTLVCLVPSVALGQTIGPHAGSSVHPEQFYFGAHADTPPLADRLRFSPEHRPWRRR